MPGGGPARGPRRRHRTEHVIGLADALARARLSVEVHGPRGRIAHLDPERTSRVSTWLIGSPHIGLDPSVWRPAVRALLARPLARRVLGGAALLSLGATAP